MSGTTTRGERVVSSAVVAGREVEVVRLTVGFAYARNGCRDANGNGTPRYGWQVRLGSRIIGHGLLRREALSLAAEAIESGEVV